MEIKDWVSHRVLLISFKGRGNVNAFLESSKTIAGFVLFTFFLCGNSVYLLIEFGGQELPLYEKEFKIRPETPT